MGTQQQPHNGLDQDEVRTLLRATRRYQRQLRDWLDDNPDQAPTKQMLTAGELARAGALCTRLEEMLPDGAEPDTSSRVAPWAWD